MILEIVLKGNYLANICLIGTYAFSQITKFFDWFGDTEVEGASTASEVQQGRAVTGISARAQMQFTSGWTEGAFKILSSDIQQTQAPERMHEASGPVEEDTEYFTYLCLNVTFQVGQNSCRTLQWMSPPQPLKVRRK